MNHSRPPGRLNLEAKEVIVELNAVSEPGSGTFVLRWRQHATSRRPHGAAKVDRGQANQPPPVRWPQVRLDPGLPEDLKQPHTEDRAGGPGDADDQPSRRLFGHGGFKLRLRTPVLDKKRRRHVTPID